MPYVKIKGNVHDEKGKIEPGTVVKVDDKDLTRLVGLDVAEETEDLPEPDGSGGSFSGMSYPELKALAKEASIEGYNKMKREDLVAALIANLQAADSSGDPTGNAPDETLEELRALAEEAGIEGFEDMDEDTLIAALEVAAQEGDQNGGAGGSQE